MLWRQRRFLSGAVPTLASGHAPGDYVRHAQGLRQMTVLLQAGEQPFRILRRDAAALHVEPGHRFHGAGRLDQAPFAGSARHPLQQGVAYRLKVGQVARNHQHRQSRGLVQPLQIDHIESRESDALQQDGLKLVEIFAAGKAVNQPLRGIGPVAPDPGRDHTVQSFAGKDRAHHQHVAPVAAIEWGIVEAHYMRDTPPAETGIPLGAGLSIEMIWHSLWLRAAHRSSLKQEQTEL